MTKGTFFFRVDDHEYRIEVSPQWNPDGAPDWVGHVVDQTDPFDEYPIAGMRQNGNASSPEACLGATVEELARYLNAVPSTINTHHSDDVILASQVDMHTRSRQKIAAEDKRYRGVVGVVHDYLVTTIGNAVAVWNDRQPLFWLHMPGLHRFILDTEDLRIAWMELTGNAVSTEVIYLFDWRYGRPDEWFGLGLNLSDPRASVWERLPTP